jgi:dTDP-4-amino-4,6-dideoxygalactose transaminase
VLAAIGLGQLDVLDDRIAARKRVNLFYQKHLADVPGIRFMPIAEYGEPNYWLSVIRCDAKRFGADVEAIRMALEAENIESRRVWVPLPQLPIYAGCRSRGGAVANAIFSESLCLPSGSALQTEDLERIVGVIRKCCRA